MHDLRRLEQRDLATAEQRTVVADVQEVRTEGRTLHGFAAVYGVESRPIEARQLARLPRGAPLRAGDDDVGLDAAGGARRSLDARRERCRWPTAWPPSWTATTRFRAVR